MRQSYWQINLTEKYGEMCTIELLTRDLPNTMNFDIYIYCR